MKLFVFILFPKLSKMATWLYFYRNRGKKDPLLFVILPCFNNCFLLSVFLILNGVNVVFHSCFFSTLRSNRHACGGPWSHSESDYIGWRFYCIWCSVSRPQVQLSPPFRHILFCLGFFFRILGIMSFHRTRSWWKIIITYSQYSYSKT